ncbi:MAG: DUF2197 domain-containing protein [Firmicutes bacterium]|nr:DUF2197 domain-containing protein [Bacillota bacterium]
MKVRCAICGKEEEINKVHKDYNKLMENPQAVYICQACRIILSSQATREHVSRGKR